MSNNTAAKIPVIVSAFNEAGDLLGEFTLFVAPGTKFDEVGRQAAFMASHDHDDAHSISFVDDRLNMHTAEVAR